MHTNVSTAESQQRESICFCGSCGQEGGKEREEKGEGRRGFASRGGCKRLAV